MPYKKPIEIFQYHEYEIAYQFTIFATSNSYFEKSS